MPHSRPPIGQGHSQLSPGLRPRNHATKQGTQLANGHIQRSLGNRPRTSPDDECLTCETMFHTRSPIWLTAIVNIALGIARGESWIPCSAAAEHHRKHLILWVMAAVCARAKARGTVSVGCVTGARLRVRCPACTLSATFVAVRFRREGHNLESGRPAQPSCSKSTRFLNEETCN
jgi:hypothetical protein